MDESDAHDDQGVTQSSRRRLRGTGVLEGINGWRMPNYAELISLDYMTGGLQGCPTCKPAIDQAAFPDTNQFISSSQYTRCYATNEFNTAKNGWYCDNKCDGRDTVDIGAVKPAIYRCVHDPLP